MQIKRFQIQKLINELNRSEISILLGPRQVGKTFLLKQLHTYALAKNKRVKYYNLEIPEDSRLFNQSPEDLFDWLTTDVDVLLIDEFHYLKNAGQLFKAIFDSGKQIKCYASGSSSIEIHKHLKESLAGRRLVTLIGPLTFNEFSQQYPPNTEWLQIFNDYNRFGGLPGIIHEPDDDAKMRLLEDIVATYIQKDIKSLIKEENIRAFNQLLYLLAESQGQLVSMSSLSREIGLSVATVNHYLSILEATYTLYPLHSFAKRLSNELKKSKKYYFYDSGIRNAILKDFSQTDRPDIGGIHEGFVFHQIKRHIKPNMEFRFWRTKQGKEIDFILLKDRKPIIIEVKTTLKNAEIPDSFNLFLQSYPETTGIEVISKNQQATIEKGNNLIQFYTFNQVENRYE
jgi:predicted AAA+ superfamily ATPase